MGTKRSGLGKRSRKKQIIKFWNGKGAERSVTRPVWNVIGGPFKIIILTIDGPMPDHFQNVSERWLFSHIKNPDYLKLGRDFTVSVIAGHHGSYFVSFFYEIHFVYSVGDTRRARCHINFARKGILVCVKWYWRGILCSEFAVCAFSGTGCFHFKGCRPLTLTRLVHVYVTLKRISDWSAVNPLQNECISVICLMAIWGSYMYIVGTLLQTWEIHVTKSVIFKQDKIASCRHQKEI
jgi:hypothetical protein